MKASVFTALLIVTLQIAAVVVSAQQNQHRNGPGILRSNFRRDLEPGQRKKSKGKKGKGNRQPPAPAPTEAPEDVNLFTPSPSVKPTGAITVEFLSLSPSVKPTATVTEKITAKPTNPRPDQDPKQDYSC